MNLPGFELIVSVDKYLSKKKKNRAVYLPANLKVDFKKLAFSSYIEFSIGSLIVKLDA